MVVSISVVNMAENDTDTPPPYPPPPKFPPPPPPPNCPPCLPPPNKYPPTKNPPTPPPPMNLPPPPNCPLPPIPPPTPPPTSHPTKNPPLNCFPPTPPLLNCAPPPLNVMDFVNSLPTREALPSVSPGPSRRIRLSKRNARKTNSNSTFYLQSATHQRLSSTDVHCDGSDTVADGCEDPAAGAVVDNETVNTSCQNTVPVDSSEVGFQGTADHDNSDNEVAEADLTELRIIVKSVSVEEERPVTDQEMKNGNSNYQSTHSWTQPDEEVFAVVECVNDHWKGVVGDFTASVLMELQHASLLEKASGKISPVKHEHFSVPSSETLASNGNLRKPIKSTVYDSRSPSNRSSQLVKALSLESYGDSDDATTTQDVIEDDASTMSTSSAVLSGGGNINSYQAVDFTDRSSEDGSAASPYTSDLALDSTAPSTSASSTPPVSRQKPNKSKQPKFKAIRKKITKSLTSIDVIGLSSKIGNDKSSEQANHQNSAADITDTNVSSAFISSRKENLSKKKQTRKRLSTENNEENCADNFSSDLSKSCLAMDGLCAASSVTMATGDKTRSWMLEDEEGVIVFIQDNTNVANAAAAHELLNNADHKKDKIGTNIVRKITSGPKHIMTHFKKDKTKQKLQKLRRISWPKSVDFEEQHEGNSLDGVLKATSPPLDDGLMSPPSSATSPPHSSHHFSYSGGDGSQHSNSPDEPGVHKEQQAAVERKLRYVVNELVETEINYVRDLADVVDGYLVEMYSVDHKMPEELQNGKDKIVFGNIAAIYEWHRDYFSKNLEECRSSPEKIGSVFIKSEKKFQMYIKYCQNKPKSEYIVSEFYDYFEDIKNKLGHKLALSDILIKPIQRLTKYQLLLKDLVKYTERAGHIEQLCTLEKALYVMTVIPRDADHMMTVGRLQDFEGNIMAQGKLLHYGPLLVSEGDSSAPFRPKVLVAFLFEQRIIFAECHKKKNQYSSDEYICKNHLQMNKLALEERCDPLDTTKFLLKSTDPRKLDLSFVCQGEDQATHHTWTSQIRRLLQTQKDFLLAIQSPIAYQKEQTKHLIDAASAWDPIVLRGEKLSTDITIESLAPVPRLPLETLLPLPPQPLDTLDDVPITVVDVSSPLGAGTSTAAQFTQASRQRDTSTVVSSNQSTVTSTAGSASDSSLWSEAPVSPSSPPMVQHRWSAGECSTGGHPSSTSHSTFYQPSPPPNFYNTNSSPAHHSGGGVFQSFSFSGGSGSGSSPPRNRRTTLFEGFKSTLRPRSKLEGGSGGLHTEAVVMQDCRGGSVSLMAGTLVQTLQPYTAIKEDEITVVRGEEVQVVSSSTRGYLIHRAATSSSPAAEGWVPAYVIQPPTPSPVSPYPPSHPSFSSSTSSSRTSPLTSKSSSPSNPFPPNSGFPSPPPPPSHVVQSQHYSKKSWIKFRKPSFSKREAKAAAQRREADMAGGCSNDAGRLLGVSAYGTTGAESSERSLGGDRNSAGSGSFGAADLYSVSNSSDISISDRLSIGGSAASDTYCHHSSTNLSSSNRSNAFIEDDTSDCVIVGEGGDELLQLVSPLSNLSIPPGQPFTLSLAVSGSGADSAIVSWFGPSGELDNDTRYELQHLRDGTIALHLGSCSAGDTGRYTCVVTSVGATATRQLRCSANVAFL